jgi:hypothetical protein
MSVMMKKPKGSTARPVSFPRTPQLPIELPEGMWDRIAQKAYELWDARGRRDGAAMQDWLDAEQMVMDEIHEARE